MTKLEILLCAVIAGLCFVIMIQAKCISRKTIYIRTLEAYLEYKNHGK